jgi:hypothetical protein
MTTFKVPQDLPQDLLLISEFIDVPEAQPQNQPKSTTEDDDDDIASSDSGIESEEEIEKDLTALRYEDEEGDIGKPLYVALPTVFSVSLNLVLPPTDHPTQQSLQIQNQSRGQKRMSERKKLESHHWIMTMMKM